ncbi:MAG: hypothetical protein KTR26_12930 [Flammeovirgaceae bacterium]|nr:hypothetical protein [Flammeovirgaceae bacterium]
MKVYSSIYSEFYYYQEENLFKHNWLSTSENFLEEEFKTEMMNYLEEVKKYKPSFVLINAQKLQFVVRSELKAWIDNNIAIQVNKILIRIAFLMPSALISQLSIEQAMEARESAKLRVRFFKDENLAINWLKNTYGGK